MALSLCLSPSTFNRLVKRRKELSAHTTLFAESFGALADAEELESLQKAMHQMADVEVKVARLHSKQVQAGWIEDRKRGLERRSKPPCNAADSYFSTQPYSRLCALVCLHRSTVTFTT